MLVIYVSVDAPRCPLSSSRYAFFCGSHPHPCWSLPLLELPTYLRPTPNMTATTSSQPAAVNLSDSQMPSPI